MDDTAGPPQHTIGTSRDATTNDLVQVLEIVRELRDEQRNTTTARRVWSVYIHTIFAACLIAFVLINIGSELALIGYSVGCSILVAVVHGLSMRPLAGRSRLTLYAAVAWILVLAWIGDDVSTFVDMICVVVTFFLTGSSIASIVGKRLSCGLLSPDQPHDRAPRPRLGHFFGLTTCFAGLLALSQFANGSSGVLSGDRAVLILFLMALYASLSSLIAVTYWGFVSNRKGIPNACTGVVLLFTIQLILNACFGAVISILQGQADAIGISVPIIGYLGSFCLAQVLPLAIFVKLLRLSGHSAAPFETSLKYNAEQHTADPLS